MSRLTSCLPLALFAFSCTVLVRVQAQAPVASPGTARPVPTAAWAPKPTTTPGYTSPHKPWVKLSDLKARHKGAANWREVLVDDGRLTGEYVSAAPGTEVGQRFHPDTREWFAVVEGQVRVEIEGQSPITASRGSLVNIPRQTLYSLEAGRILRAVSRSWNTSAIRC